MITIVRKSTPTVLVFVLGAMTGYLYCLYLERRIHIGEI